MRRPEEVQVVFKDCQTRTAKIRMRQKRTGTAEGQWRRAIAKGNEDGADDEEEDRDGEGEGDGG